MCNKLQEHRFQIVTSFIRSIYISSLEVRNHSYGFLLCIVGNGLFPLAHYGYVLLREDLSTFCASPSLLLNIYVRIIFGITSDYFKFTLKISCILSIFHISNQFWFVIETLLSLKVIWIKYLQFKNISLISNIGQNLWPFCFLYICNN